MPEEEKHNFDKQAADLAWLAENPDVTIPDEVESDLDNDFQ